MSVQFNTSQNPHHQYYVLGDELVSVVKSRCLRGQEFKFRVPQALLKKSVLLIHGTPSRKPPESRHCSAIRSNSLRSTLTCSALAKITSSTIRMTSGSSSLTMKAVRWHPPSFDIRVETLHIPEYAGLSLFEPRFLLILYRIQHPDDAIIKVKVSIRITIQSSSSFGSSVEP